MTERPVGPPAPRWTHVALPSADIETSVEWYTTFMPLEVLARHADDDGKNAWLSHPGATATPFVLVLVMFNAEAGHPNPQLAPFAHLGIELPERADVDAIAAKGAAADCLVWEARQLPPPVGYVCALSDPDGNVVEFSHDQGVYAAVDKKWGTS
jgi:catechol 2,3-dioxygenase-like lactoylglutathione lyase family enzyme